MAGNTRAGPAWAGGYYTALPYVTQYTHELCPAHLAFVTGIAGYQVPDITKPFTWLDLGCGTGLTAAMLGPLYPHAQFYAVDFNPDHVAFGDDVARDIGARNVTFIEAAFGGLDEAQLPEFDFVVLHGIMTWVGAAARRDVLGFLQRKVKRGGIVFASYNCMPGWAASVPLRDFIRRTYEATPGRPEDRLAAALDAADQLAGLNQGYTALNPVVGQRLSTIRGQDTNYLLHEYMNQHWDVFYHREMVAELADAKLSWIGHGAVADALPDLCLTPAAQRYLASVTDPAERETMRDYVINSQFRRDLFARGRLRASLTDQITWAAAQRFAAVHPSALLPETMPAPIGEVTLDRRIHGTIAQALDLGPLTADQVTALPALAGMRREEAFIHLTTLVVAGHVRPLAPAPIAAAARDGAQRANLALLRRAMTSAPLPALLTPEMGSALVIDPVMQLLLGAMLGGVDPMTTVPAILAQRGQSFTDHSGRRLDAHSEITLQLEHSIDEVRRDHLPRLQGLGALP